MSGQVELAGGALVVNIGAEIVEKANGRRWRLAEVDDDSGIFILERVDGDGTGDGTLSLSFTAFCRDYGYLAMPRVADDEIPY